MHILTNNVQQSKKLELKYIAARPSCTLVASITCLLLLVEYGNGSLTYPSETLLNSVRHPSCCYSDVITVPCKHFAASANRAQNGDEKTHFPNFLSPKTTHRFIQSPVADFLNIWTQNVNQCHHEYFRNRIAKVFRWGIIYPKNLDFMVFWHTSSASAPANWPLGIERICISVGLMVELHQQ